MKPYYQDDSETTSEWSGCYDSGWQGEITPESFSHPAKFSRALIRRIYEHAFEQGWLKAGDVVADPFGGVALGALDAMWHGLNWLGMELEPKFVNLGYANLALWRRKYGNKADWGSARIIQGDSRRLAEVIGKTDLVCSSPPYSETALSGGKTKKGQGYTRGQRCLDDYGSSPGQLGVMKEGDFDCVVGSPPYEGSLNSGQNGIDWDKAKRPERWGGNRDRRGCQAAANHKMAYGRSENQLGATTADTFWSAAREIVAQCHAILKPGGHAIWVTKRFVRSGKIVEFSDQWLALCRSVGFELVCRHRAMLVAEHGTQPDIFGGEKRLTTARKSFFRRLAERKGSPVIDWEDILCLIKK